MKNKKFNVLRILGVYNFVIILLGIVFYNLIPELLNYGPETINSYFETQIDAGYYYYMQYSLIVIAVIILVDAYVLFQIRGLDKWHLLLYKDDEESKKQLDKIKEKCFRTSYLIYIYQLLAFPLAILLILYLTKVENALIIKIMGLIFSFAALSSIITYIFTKNIFKKILEVSNNQKMYFRKIKFTLKSKVFFQILPLFLVTAIFIGLFGYSKLVEEKGKLLFQEYSSILDTTFPEDVYECNEIIAKLKDMRRLDSTHTGFVLNEYTEMYNEGEELSDFIKKYTILVAEKYDGHIYDYYGSDIQGTVKYLRDSDYNYYVVGIKYSASSMEMLIVIVGSMLCMLAVCIVYLIYFSKEMSFEIVAVSKYLSRLSHQDEIDYDKKLPVTSNDEIGELIISFNKILDLEKKNIETKERNQEIMIEQERLSSLGQLIGGIAHNLKTPIMSIAGAVEGLTDLIKEYDESIDDSKVTNDDHHEIAKEMKVWVDKIKPYLSYMTEVIDTVKGQAVSMNASTMHSFSAKELIARTQILLRDELKRRHCNLNLNLEVDEKSNISGEISAIVQVIDNLIINAMDAYKEDGGDIDIYVHEDEEKIYIEVKDYAGGIPEHVQDKLFKEMITTKGKNGTGLGLYMSYSTIKGKFNGDMHYETEKDKGTTFFIELNKFKDNN